MTPEQLARLQIDALLVAAGWAVQDYGSYNPGAARGIGRLRVSIRRASFRMPAHARQ